MIIIEEYLQNVLLDAGTARSLAALSAISILTVLPLTFVRKLWSISVGYGASIGTMSLAMILASFRVNIANAPRLLVLVSLLYGIRLAGFLLLRHASVKSMEKQGEKAESMSRPKATILAVFVSFLYANLVMPVLFSLRVDIGNDDDAWRRQIQIFGVVVSSVGLSIESVADWQKYAVKKQAKVSYGHEKFVGPTGGFYAIVRHPNYLGEIVFWLGLYIGGAVCFKDDIIAWISSTLGLWSIISIMLGSTKRLEKKQQDLYGKQKSFQEWRSKVRAPLVPFVEREVDIMGMK